MNNIVVDFTKTVGKIKPVHGVGQPPFVGIDYSLCTYLKEAHIPFSRLHDVAGYYGGNVYVDIPNLFRDFDADPCDPEAYDFAFTDLLIKALAENGVEPFFRLGVTIENYVCVKAYRIYPPKDYLKWAKICEGVTRHYTEGWANGFHYNIGYWEIWNEPDNYEEIEENQMWRGTKEQYFELYRVAAAYLKEKFPHLKIGGYASCGFYSITNEMVLAANSSPRTEYFVTFFEAFLKFVKEHNLPLDFFSWHSYDTVERNMLYAQYARNKLDEAGFTQTETTCNEWNAYPEKRGTAFHAAQNTAMLIAFQNSPLDSAMFYDAGISLFIYGGMFHPMTHKPYPLYYGFRLFGELYVLGNQVCTNVDAQGLYTCAAKDGNKGGILIVNIGDEQPLHMALLGGRLGQCYIIDEDNTFTPCVMPATIGTNTIIYMEADL